MGETVAGSLADQDPVDRLEVQRLAQSRSLVDRRAVMPLVQLFSLRQATRAQRWHPLSPGETGTDDALFARDAMVGPADRVPQDVTIVARRDTSRGTVPSCRHLYLLRRAQLLLPCLRSLDHQLRGLMLILEQAVVGPVPQHHSSSTLQIHRVGLEHRPEFMQRLSRRLQQTRM